MFDRIIIFGLGLIGGSIARDVRVKNLAKEIFAFDQDRSNLELALSLKFIDGIYKFDCKIGKQDLVIIATPILSYEAVIESILPFLDDDSNLIDVGSVKYFIEKDLFKKWPQLSAIFVPCHPIAGLEKSGFESSINDLFLNKKLIITKSAFLDDKRFEMVENFWQNLGSQIEVITAKDHDKIFALTSHFVQFLSHNFKDNFDEISIKNPLFLKHSRLENSSLKMWLPIFNFNHENLQFYQKLYNSNLDKLIEDIDFDRYKSTILSLDLALSLVDDEKYQIDINDLNFALNSEVKLLLVFERILAVSALVLIDDIKAFKSYWGSGFKDFTIILLCLKCQALKDDRLISFIKNNKKYLLNSLHKLKNIKL